MQPVGPLSFSQRLLVSAVHQLRSDATLTEATVALQRLHPGATLGEIENHLQAAEESIYAARHLLATAEGEAGPGFAFSTQAEVEEEGFLDVLATDANGIVQHPVTVRVPVHPGMTPEELTQAITSRVSQITEGYGHDADAPDWTLEAIGVY